MFMRESGGGGACQHFGRRVLRTLLLRVERLLHLEHVPPLFEKARGRRHMVESEALRQCSVPAKGGRAQRAGTSVHRRSAPIGRGAGTHRCFDAMAAGACSYTVEATEAEQPPGALT